MSVTLFGLPAALWVNEVGEYLATDEILRLRLLSRDTLAFFAAHLSDFAALLEQRLTNLRESMPVEVRDAQMIVLLNEPRRQQMLQTEFNPRSLIELTSYSNPPNGIAQTLGIAVCLVHGKMDLGWDRVKMEVRNLSFFSELKQKCSAASLQKINPKLKNEALALSEQALANVSVVCSQLVRFMHDYFILQDEYHREEAKCWFSYSNRLIAIEKRKNIFSRVVQGMPQELKKKPKQPGSKKSGKKAPGMPMSKVKKAGKKN